MCGIVSLVARADNFVKLSEVFYLLEKLEYRGYDSAGIAYQNDREVVVSRAVGDVAKLRRVCEDELRDDLAVKIAISHTRWATHGRVSTANAHPHTFGKVTLIHNGVIDNVTELKDIIGKKTNKLHSQTDSEVVAALIDHLLEEYSSANIELLFARLIELAKGSFALLFMLSDVPNRVFFIKNKSPLILAQDSMRYFLCSDVIAVSDNVNSVYFVQDNEFGFADSDNVSIYRDGNILPVEWKEFAKNSVNEIDKGGFDHFMIKEINDEPLAIRTAMQYSVDFLKNKIKLPQIDDLNFKNIQRIIMIGCGSSYYASCCATNLIQSVLPSVVIQNFIASEFRYQECFSYNKNHDLYILISQSGETADVVAVIDKLKSIGCVTIGLTNYSHSTIARLCDYHLCCNVGQEVSVAATKTFITQFFILYILAIRIGRKIGIIDSDHQSREINLMMSVPELLEEYINNFKMPQSVIDCFNVVNNAFYLGRGLSYSLCQEAALKMKELCYIFAEAIPIAELKHGPIAVIDDKSIVCISFLNEDNIVDKNISSLEVIVARGGRLILFTTDNVYAKLPNSIKEHLIHSFNIRSGHSTIANFTVFTALMQLMTYYISVSKNINVDRPKNLAKSVTVE